MIRAGVARRIALPALLALTSCAVTVRGAPGDGGAPGHDALPPGANDAPRVATLSLPISVRALTVQADDTLVVGGSWSGEAAFAGEAPWHDPTAPASRGAVAWIGADRGVLGTRALVGQTVGPSRAAHGVAALAAAPDGAVWAVASAGTGDVIGRAAVMRFTRPEDAATTVTVLAALGDEGLVDAALAPSADGMATCVRTVDAFTAPHSERTLRRGRAWCGWIGFNRAPQAAPLRDLASVPLPDGVFTQTLLAGVTPRGAVWALRSLLVDDPDRWDALRPEERALLTTRPTLDELSMTAPARRIVLEARLSPAAVLPLGEGRLRVVSASDQGRWSLDDYAEARVRSREIPVLFDDRGRDVSRGSLVAYSTDPRRLGLVLALPSSEGLAVLTFSLADEVRLVAVIPDLRGDGGGPVALAGTARGWVIAQSGRLDGPARPIRAELRWLPR